MKTLTNKIMIAAMMTAICATPTAFAQDAHIPLQLTVNDGEVRQDKIGWDLRTPASKNDKVVYYRTITAANGFYDVVVKDKDGNLRMTGRFLDQDATLADGQFTFYYPNGNVESSGLYSNNVKAGTWLRYAEDGSPKAERNYTGMTWEDMAVKLGVSEKAELAETN